MMGSDDLPALTFTTIGFFSIAGLTWFFSSRPRLFIRVFVPADELRGAARGILRDPHFGRGMRFMALLQAAVATAITVACWFVSR
jgi:hypothetical protein